MGCTLLNQASTKKAMRARVRGAVGEECEAGKNVGEGKESARNWETMADSVMISSSRRPFDNFMLGTRPRWEKKFISKGYH